MEASVRIFHSFNRHSFFKNPFIRLPFTNNHSPFVEFSLHSRNHSQSHFFAWNSHFSNTPIFNSFSTLQSPHISTSRSHFARIFSGSKRKSFEWNFALEESINDGIEQAEVAVVLLGWLGAKRKHLRRYVELYNSRGIHTVTFMTSVRDVLSYDMGRGLEERIVEFAGELISWLTKKDGRERFFIFHTFSNTGWLAYGAILDHVKDRQELLEKIKGCVIDSGGDPNIDPKVWAAGFTAALLKKRSSAVYPSVEAGDGNRLGSAINGSKIQEKEPLLIESLLLSAFEKLFSFFLNLPDVNQRVTKIVSALSMYRPPSPQLYLYSTADKVIPYHAVESFIEDQKRIGKQVFSFNFGSSPHVDHYRTFPDVYASQLHKFLKECLAMVGKIDLAQNLIRSVTLPNSFSFAHSPS
ncbi:transmembrane protein 53 [Forsythia ovata]|uniref:Transmembrane protein 53 n=1 Tax=Forsythia ovata TaxID=205694 RepID=A0ABD1WTB8_9LAMI